MIPSLRWIINLWDNHLNHLWVIYCDSGDDMLREFEASTNTLVRYRGRLMRTSVILCLIAISALAGYHLVQTTPADPVIRDEKHGPEIKVYVTLNTEHETPSYGYLVSGDNTLWLGGNRLWRSDDRGKAWKEISVPTMDGDLVHQVDFLDAKSGWIYIRRMNGSSDLFRTQDGGISWNKIDHTIASNIPSHYFADVRLTSSETGIAKCTDGKLYLSIDGGKSWKIVLSGDYVHDIYFVNDSAGWIVSDFRDMKRKIKERRLMKTEDGGRTWKQTTTPPFIDDSVIDKSIKKSPDVTNAWMGHKNIRFVNDLQGWIFGDHGDVYRTIDGGKTWESANHLYDWQMGGGNDLVIRDGSFVDEKVGYLVGDKGRIWKTTDSGKTWRQLQSGTKENLLSVFFASATDGWCVRSDAIMQTVDGGEHWTMHTPGSEESTARQKKVKEIEEKVKKQVLSGSEIIKGEMINKESGKGIAGIAVDLTLTVVGKENDASYIAIYTWRQTTDENGKYSFTNLPEAHRAKTTKSIILEPTSLTKDEALQTVGQRFALSYRGIPHGLTNARISRGEGVELVKGDPLTLRHELEKK